MAAAVLPVAVALFAPQRHHLLLFVASAALFVGGFVLYVVQELRSRRERPSHPKEPPRFLEGDPVDMEGAEP